MSLFDCSFSACFCQDVCEPELKTNCPIMQFVRACVIRTPSVGVSAYFSFVSSFFFFVSSLLGTFLFSLSLFFLLFSSYLSPLHRRQRTPTSPSAILTRNLFSITETMSATIKGALLPCNKVFTITELLERVLLFLDRDSPRSPRVLVNVCRLWKRYNNNLSTFSTPSKMYLMGLDIQDTYSLFLFFSNICVVCLDHTYGGR